MKRTYTVVAKQNIDVFKGMLVKSRFSENSVLACFPKLLTLSDSIALLIDNTLQQCLLDSVNYSEGAEAKLQEHSVQAIEAWLVQRGAVVTGHRSDSAQRQ